jgi:AbrB family looped-hinge helix DNA binding protein
MDAAGRLVIPAVARRELALTGGTELAVAVEDGALVLRPQGRARLLRRAGRLVLASPLSAEVPDHRELRDERDARQLGRRA